MLILWHHLVMKTYQSKEVASFIGRTEEIKVLNEVSASGEASIVVAYGRRRVGKTTLIEHVYRKRNLLKFEGLEVGDAKKQRQHFLDQLADYSEDPKISRLEARTWKDVFLYLYDFVKKGTWTIFFEELQWMSCYDSELISEFKFVWDNYFQKNGKIIFVLCGSSPSFMIQSVVLSKALYNRSQRNIHLQPFTIEETKTFLKRSITTMELFDLYLSVGGIPEYLKYFRKSDSCFLRLTKATFIKDGELFPEVDKILASSFSKEERYFDILKSLGSNKYKTREELAKSLKIKTGGNFSKQLFDLEQTGLIAKRQPIDAKEKSKLVKYEIADPFLQFYFKFVLSKKQDILLGRYNKNPSVGLDLNKYRQWLGYSFERWCRYNHFKIGDKLGFSSVDYKVGPYFKRDEKGTQVDLLFLRKDRVATVCEIKYTVNPVGIDAYHDLEQRVLLVQKEFHQYSIQKVLISASGAEKKIKNGAYFDSILTLEDLLEN